MVVVYGGGASGEETLAADNDFLEPGVGGPMAGSVGGEPRVGRAGRGGGIGDPVGGGYVGECGVWGCSAGELFGDFVGGTAGVGRGGAVSGGGAGNCDV